MPSDQREPSREPTAEPEAPALSAALLDPWPVIVAGAVLWLLATVAAFTIGALESWRPIAIAGLGTGVVGTSIFLLQRTAARRGARGAQTGLERYTDNNKEK